MLRLPSAYPLSWCESQGPWRDILSPNDGSQITKVQFVSSSDLETLPARLTKGQKLLKALSNGERVQILRKVSETIANKKEELATLIAWEGGKPLRDARAEVERAATTFDLCAQEAIRLHGESLNLDLTAAGKMKNSYTIRQPIGPVLALSAFNHPLNLLAHQVGCAIGAGCAVVLKPSPNTPVCAHFLEELLYQAGLPKESFTLLHADIPQIDALLANPSFSYVTFIGAARVGWEIRKKIAYGTRLNLEHGGQAASIVMPDADLDLATNMLIKGAFYHSGQVCISTQKIYVHSSTFDSFVQMFKMKAQKLLVGDARKEETDLGPLIRPSEVSRIITQIHEAESKRAQVILGGKNHSMGLNYMGPCILTHVPPECKIMKEEVFGPVVCINPFDNLNNLIDELNSSRYQFSSSLFTKDLATTMKVTEELDSMEVVVNDHTAFRVDLMPFGGHRESGLGMGGVKYMMEEMTRLKLIILPQFTE